VTAVGVDCDSIRNAAAPRDQDLDVGTIWRSGHDAAAAEVEEIEAAGGVRKWTGRDENTCGGPDNQETAPMFNVQCSMLKKTAMPLDIEH